MNYLSINKEVLEQELCTYKPIYIPSIVELNNENILLIQDVSLSGEIINILEYLFIINCVYYFIKNNLYIINFIYYIIKN